MTHVTPQWMIEQGFSPTFADRFWSKVDKTELCWIWKANKGRRGYGMIMKRKAHPIESHRASWMLRFGPIPEGLNVCHNCPYGDNPSCVNPDHLWLGTQTQNMQDASAKGRLSVSHPNYCGETNHAHKLTKQQVDEIRRIHTYRNGPSIAKRFGVSNQTIWRIVNHKIWNHG